MAKCTCIDDLKNAETEMGRKLLEALQESNPGSEVSNIHSTVFWFDEGIPASTEFKYDVSRTTKKGTTSKHVKSITVRAFYCPICGLDKDGKPGKG